MKKYDLMHLSIKLSLLLLSAAFAANGFFSAAVMGGWIASTFIWSFLFLRDARAMFVAIVSHWLKSRRSRRTVLPWFDPDYKG